MANSPKTFDPIGIVVDWLDACRERRLLDLVGLYADEASVECCTGGQFQGRTEVVRYWTPKLEQAQAGAFLLKEVQPDGTRVRLDYRDYDGRAVRTTFRFDGDGKIVHTTCSPLQDNGKGQTAA